MSLFLDSFWRTLAYCLHPRIIALSFLPLLLLAVFSLVLFWFCWEPAVQGIQSWLTDWGLMDSLLQWLESVSLGHLGAALAPLLMLLLVLPLVVVLSLLAVAWLVTPAVVQVVAERRFAALARRHGGSFLGSLWQGLGSALLALLALLITLPLWLIPPLAVVVPPLIWGWLNTRVMSYDTLAEHASAEEREALLARHGYRLLAIGVVTAYAGAAPGLIWAVGAMAIVLAPLLVPLAIWIYTFVFIFSSLWFTHYGLAALAALRAEAESAPSRSGEAPRLASAPHV